MDEFDILQIVGEGWFGKILLVEHKATDTEMVLKGTKPIRFYFDCICSLLKFFAFQPFRSLM
jgi:hypothetical protein